MKRTTLAALLAIALIAAPLLSATRLHAEGTPIKGLSRFRLDNGLELFVLENHTVPLARIQITFRCGAITQTPETAGLFHLYEHMLFKGNSKYKTETEFASAMTELGVAEWNGGTSTEYVDYYFTVPSNKVNEGLEFWSHAVREPLFSAEELLLEKDVVVNEINGGMGDPDHIYQAALTKTMFSKYPWRRDVGGYEKTIRSATADMLKTLQGNYYIPNNAAIFVGGDVKPQEVYKLVNDWYGNWKKGADPWVKPLPAHDTPAVSKPAYLVMPDESLPQGIAYLLLTYRGPDVIATPAPTYAADVWGFLLDNPDGRFKNAIMEKVPGLYNKDYIGASYYTQRDGGQIFFSTYFFTDPELPIAQRAIVQFKDAVVGGELTAMIEDAAYFSAEEFDMVKVKLEDQQLIGLETAEKFIESLSFWWASASTDYYFNYIANMKKVEQKDIAGFLRKYVMENKEVIVVRVNPADYEAEKTSLETAGFITVTPENAFWWEARK